MATTRLSDAVIPEVYADYQAENTPEKTAFFESGVVVRNPMLDQKANTGGQEIQVPFWRDLDASVEPNASNDDPADMAAPNKLGSGLQKARISYLNQGYSAADLVVELAGSDPMQRIRNRFGTYWQRQWQRRIIASAVGLLAANEANDDGDMVYDGAAGLWSRQAFTSAVFTLGDAFGQLSAIAVHSLAYKQMIDADDIDFVPDSQGNLTIPTFMGQRVIVDDSMPATSAGDPATITTTAVLFGAGAFGYGEGSPEVPEEIERQARAGNGGGVETLWERKTWILHPFGYQFTGDDITNRANLRGRTGADTSVDEFSPLLADLRKAANWNRVVDRKNVPIAFLKIKGA
ncbi:phage coat protein [Pseudomonas sp. NMI542_15]|uniref:phage coat protein n=1 Tax=Pseudomonas sp. NMI542_15 TaxID=2903148 RepID=UPI001E2B01BE|nr:phage coat protein [Pseudomonas sp. NMI542_15]MCE0778925.1 phage coat protein [Pseudomonas sp. NMI542_15]